MTLGFVWSVNFLTPAEQLPVEPLWKQRPKKFKRRWSSTMQQDYSRIKMGVEQFERKLAAEMDSLCQAASPCLTISWLQKALHVLQSAQLDMARLVGESPMLQEEKREWLKGCIQGLEGLLQVCSILQKSILDIGHYGMFVQLAVQAADKGQYSRARHLLGLCIDDERVRVNHAMAMDHREVSRLSLQKARLQSCRNLLLHMVEQQQAEQKERPDFLLGSAISGLRITSIFVLLVLAACLTIKPNTIPPVTSSSRAITNYVLEGVDGEPLWWSSLCKLHLRIKSQIVGVEGAFALLHEVEKVDRHARELHELLLLLEQQDKQCHVSSTSLSQRLQTLRTCVEDVQAGLPLLELQIHEISKVISTARTTVLYLP